MAHTHMFTKPNATRIYCECGKSKPMCPYCQVQLILADSNCDTDSDLYLCPALSARKCRYAYEYLAR